MFFEEILKFKDIIKNYKIKRYRVEGKSYQFHKHIGKDETVAESEPFNLNKVLKYISENFDNIKTKS